MIDSHCHLADSAFNHDLPDVIARALGAGVDRMIVISDSLQEASRCRTVAEKYEQIFYTAGVHPHGAKEWGEGSRELLLELLRSSPKARAIGEIGLDYHYMHSSQDDQRGAFRQQLLIANELDLPCVIHNRESIGDLLSIVRELLPKKMVLHCCTERWEDVAELIDRGYLLSFTGIATYPKSGEIRETIKRCPLTQMMVETDAPYMAPVPHRGSRNEPAYVVEVAKLIAELKEVSYEEVDRVTTANAVEFFGLCL